VYYVHWYSGDTRVILRWYSCDTQLILVLYPEDDREGILWSGHGCYGVNLSRLLVKVTSVPSWFMSKGVPLVPPIGQKCLGDELEGMITGEQVHQTGVSWIILSPYPDSSVPCNWRVRHQLQWLEVQTSLCLDFCLTAQFHCNRPLKLSFKSKLQ
jgi:hypothetical protein